MQAELPRGRFRRAVDVLAARLECGTPPDKVLAAAAARLPAHVRGMLAAGAGSGRLFEVLQECLELEQLQSDIRRRILSALAYPLVVLSLAAAWVAFVLGWVVPTMVTIYTDFEIELPHMTQALIRLARPGVVVALLSGLTLLIATLSAGLIWRSAAVGRLIGLLPLIGPLWRAGHLAAFCRLLATMLDQSLPLPAALRLTAEGVADADIKAVCRRAARGVESGRALSACLVRERAMPPTLALILRWGERLSADSEALRAAAELFRADGNAGRSAGRRGAADRVSGRRNHDRLGRNGDVHSAGQTDFLFDLKGRDVIDLDPTGLANLFVFGLTIWIATRLVFGPDPGTGGSVELLLRLTVVIALVVSWFGLLFLFMSAGAVVLFLASCIVAAMTVVQINVQRRRALAELLALAVEKRMPLSAVVRAFGAEQPLTRRYRWERFALELQSGADLAPGARASSPARAAAGAGRGENRGFGRLA